MDKAPDAFRTISEVADELDLPQHVLRFWETRFSQIRPLKRGGGRRYYRPEDVDLLRGIRHLLYGEGYTIRGVQRILKDQGAKFVQTVWQAGAPQPKRLATDDEAGTPPADERDAVRGRRLFRLLPSMLGEAAPDEAVPGGATPGGAAPAGASAVPPAREEARAGAAAAQGPLAGTRAGPDRPRIESGEVGRLSREDIRRLQATLHELTECRRLLDAALG